MYVIKICNMAGLALGLWTETSSAAIKHYSDYSKHYVLDAIGKHVTSGLTLLCVKIPLSQGCCKERSSVSEHTHPRAISPRAKC